MSLHAPALQWIARTFNMSEAWVAASAYALAGVLAGFVVHRILIKVFVPLASRTSTDLDDFLLRTSATPIAFTLALLGFLTGAKRVWTGPGYDELYRRLFITGLLIIWGAAAAQMITHALRHATRHVPGIAQARGSAILGRLAKLAMGIIVLLTLFGVWSVDVTPLLASAGLVGIALALAAQDTLSNFFAGLAVYLDHIYEVGDIVVLEQGTSGEVRGEVRDIGLRSTRIMTRDDVLVTVPNAVIANGRVINESGQRPQYRIRVPVSVSYKSDLDHVQAVLERIAQGHPLVLPDPVPRGRVRTFANSGINVELLAWIRDPRDKGLVTHDLSKAIHKRFAAENITIPFPQTDVHLHTTEPSRPPARP